MVLCDAKVEGNGTVWCEGGAFVGVVKGDYFGAWWMHVVSVGVKWAVDLFVGSERGQARGA